MNPEISDVLRRLKDQLNTPPYNTTNTALGPVINPEATDSLKLLKDQLDAAPFGKLDTGLKHAILSIREDMAGKDPLVPLLIRITNPSAPRLEGERLRTGSFVSLEIPVSRLHALASNHNVIKIDAG